MTNRDMEIDTKNLDIVGIGNAIVDVLIETEDSFLNENELTKGSMSLINQEKATQLYFRSKSSLETSGGSVANTIAGLSALGSSAGFIGRVKEDELGNTFIKDLCSTGAVFNALPIREGPSTARCFIYVTPDAERTMCTYLGSSVLLEPKDIDFSIVSKTKLLYLEGYLWDLDSAKSSFITAAELCKANGGKVALSLSDTFCIERHRESFQLLVEKYVDILFANENEIIALYKSKNFEASVEAIRKKCEICVLTKGAEGSIIINENKRFIINTYKFGKTIDTTGAGDLYASGFLHGYLSSKNLEVCGHIGSICAGYIVTQLGSRSTISLQKLVKENLSLL